MFWGLIIHPRKKYSQTVTRGFHLSQAALDLKTATSDNVQLILTHENSTYILCTLNKTNSVQVPLDLNFSEGDAISFATDGGTIHLSGYVVDEFSDYSDAEDEDVPATMDNVKNSKKSAIQSKGEEEDSEDDDDDDDESDDNLEEDTDDEDDDENNDEDVNGADNDSEEEVESAPKKQKLDKDLVNGKKKKNEKVNPNVQPDKEKKVLQGGIIVQDVRKGKGADAKPGKKVQVYYEGRLKSNNKLFDKTTTGEGFKFSLGRGEVIKGWDIGVVGMKVGGKRRIICPPQMAYGKKGSPPAIPPNSTLVFDVELRAVH